MSGDAVDSQLLLDKFSRSSSDPWYVIEYPGPVIRFCSAALLKCLHHSTDDQSEQLSVEPFTDALVAVFDHLPRRIAAETEVALPERLERFDHAFIIPVNAPDTADAFLVYLRQRFSLEIEADARRKRFESLSVRQAEILSGVYSGVTNRSLAESLGISLKTVEKHRSNGMRKLGASSLVELVRLIAEFQSEQGRSNFDRFPSGSALEIIAARSPAEMADSHA